MDSASTSPFRELPEQVKDLIFYGSKGEKIEIVLPEGARQGEQHAGKKMAFPGVVPADRAALPLVPQAGPQPGRHGGLPAKGDGGLRLSGLRRRALAQNAQPGARRRQRLFPKPANLHLRDLQKWLATLDVAADKTAVAATVVREIDGRVDLLIGIGLDYLNLNRRSGTLSGGESQRIRLSTQIGSGLMGMLYVLDEPSIGLHPRTTSR